MAKQAVLDMLALQRLLEQRIVSQIDHPHRKVVARPPVGVHQLHSLSVNGFCVSASVFGALGCRVAPLAYCSTSCVLSFMAKLLLPSICVAFLENTQVLSIVRFADPSFNVTVLRVHYS